MSNFLAVYGLGLIVILFVIVILWFISVKAKDAGLIETAWGLSFVFVSAFYYVMTNGLDDRKIIVACLVALWAFRLAVFMFWRSFGKGEAAKYGVLRQKYGHSRYWWVSFFHSYLPKVGLAWIVSAPILGSMYFYKTTELGGLDFFGIFVWIIGMLIEIFSDIQMVEFMSVANNKNKVMSTGLWNYSRHPNYFGNALSWWGLSLLAIANGSYFTLIGPIVLTYVLMNHSGTQEMEKKMLDTLPGYKRYYDRTSAFFPRVPKE